MPSTGILQVRNCIHVTARLYFHLDLLSKLLFKKFRDKTGKTRLNNYMT